MKIVLATNNPHKLSEMRALFASTSVELLSMSDVGIKKDVIENGKTFTENALIKAEAIAQLTSLPVMADDSGLEVKALGNFPGIYSARFMEGHSYFEKNLEIIRMLQPYEDRSAQFTCVIALCNLTPRPLVFTGIAQGSIDSEPQGSHGFGYDPIFVSSELHQSFGLASEDDKNKVSHRSKAASQVIDYLKLKKLI